MESPSCAQPDTGSGATDHAPAAPAHLQGARRAGRAAGAQRGQLCGERRRALRGAPGGLVGGGRAARRKREVQLQAAALALAGGGRGQQPRALGRRLRGLRARALQRRSRARVGGRARALRLRSARAAAVRGQGGVLG